MCSETPQRGWNNHDPLGLLESGGGKDACPCDRCCSDLPKEESSSKGSWENGFDLQQGYMLQSCSWLAMFVVLCQCIICQLTIWSVESIRFFFEKAWLVNEVLSQFRGFGVNTWRGIQVNSKSVSLAAKCCCHQGMGLKIRHRVAIILLFFLHSGEAINPGPHHDGQTWVLGTFNPSGLNGKQQVLNEHLAYGDIWAVAETHLSSKAMQTFRRGLCCSQSPFKYVVGGYPTPVRQHSQHSGTWTGVATISRFPTRQVPVEWPPDVFQTSRVVVTTTLCNDLWISGGVVYGEPPGIQHPFAQMHTEQLLNSTIEAVVQLRGCRYVAGDWNFQQGHLEAFKSLHQHGFKDLQTIAEECWGRQPQMTCKGVTRKDFMFVSPELRELLVDVILEHDVWSDHSVLCGKFQGGPQQVPRFVWRMPQTFPWPKNFSSCDIHLDVDFDHKDPTQEYTHMWEQVENQAELIVRTSGNTNIKNNMKGRGATLETVRKCGASQPALLKNSRKGDVEPQLHGASVKHAQWFRQLRRLQAYSRFVRMHPTDTEGAHGAQLWRSILVAKGFPVCFSTWWNNECETMLDGAPLCIPLAAPSLAIAEAIYTSFLAEVRRLEGSLKHARRQHGIKRRREQATLVFKDVKAVPPDRVDVLLNSKQATIVEVCNIDGCITMNEALDFDNSQPCVINGISHNIVFAEAEWVYLEDVTGIEPMQVISQHRFVGRTTDMFQEFEKEWTRRWNRHSQVLPSQWDQIVAFAQATIPNHPFEVPELTPQQIVQAASTKKKHSATGPDGVSLVDIMQAPKQVHQHLCDMLHRSEKTGDWPQQVIVGKVASLAKTEAPTKVSEYRPITIFAQIYRLWGSIRSKQILKAIDKICPPTLLGNRPGKHAMQQWMYTQWLIETAHVTGQELAGVTADIQKAFNHLPRHVVMAAGKCVGIPQNILVAWAGALSQMTRRFEIRDSLGPPISSTTGCPEGCSMSCIGMLLIDMLFHHWISQQCPLADPLSYVDDWQVLTNDSTQVPMILESLETFTTEVDLLLDRNKTYAWSTKAGSRQQLRTQQVVLKSQARGLGAQMQYTRQHCSKVLVKRMHDLVPLWPKLRQSLSPYFLKVQVLSRAAWPKGLHAVGATHVGSSRFGALRAGAMKGIEASGAGCNAWVHLGMIESPEADPQFWSTKETFRATRLCQNEDQLRMLLDMAAEQMGDLPIGGPTSAFVNRVHFLGWSLHSGAMIQDRWGTFSFFKVSMQELVLRLGATWQFVVASKIATRPCFEGIHRADVWETRRYLSLLPKADQGLFRKALNGAAFTNDILCHFTETGSTACSFCGAVDSRMHRFWQCPVFASERQSLSQDVLELLPELPSCLTQAGWALQAPTQDMWWKTLIEVEVGKPQKIDSRWLDKHGWVDVFTDGSCSFPTEKALRFASWSVCRADADLSLTNSTIIAVGGLPGILQSAYRAELFAVVQALKWASQYQTHIRIWSDCQGVVSKVRKMLQGVFNHNPNSCNSDLWTEAYDALKSMPQNACVITKVAAHQDLDAATTSIEQWAFMHNALADRAARLANQCRPASFWKVQQWHQQSVTHMQYVNREVQQVIMAVSRRAVMRTILNEEIQDEFHGEQQAHQQEIPSGALPSLHVRNLAPLKAAQRFGHRLTALVTSWFQEGFEQAERALEQPIWVSWFQLYIDYQQRTGDAGPYYDKGWRDPQKRPMLKSRPYNFRKRCAWFVQLAKMVLALNDLSFSASVTRPNSVMLALHTASIYVVWPKNRLQEVERWLHRCLPRAATRAGKLLNGLPIAEQLGGQSDLRLQQGPLG